MKKSPGCFHAGLRSVNSAIWSCSYLNVLLLPLTYLRLFCKLILFLILAVGKSDSAPFRALFFSDCRLIVDEENIIYVADVLF
ncbi:MAG: hypothetical protein S4CHLAM102_06260 [Chlamydiia bacterium]|nr:hypothetical protein [Chlamydiia bacterium]